MTYRFEIFRGSLDSPTWIEEAITLEVARDRMISTACKLPGRYFVYDYSAHLVMYSVDTTLSGKRMEPPLWNLQIA